MKTFQISVPGSTSNIGPGFDCLGLALDLRNEFTFRFDKAGVCVKTEGYHAKAEEMPEENLILRAFRRYSEVIHKSFPDNIQVACVNRVPMGSGLGSSSTAIVAGILAADTYFGQPLPKERLLQIATEFEGHPDNVTPAIFGGFTAAMSVGEQVVMKHFPIADWQICLVVPHFHVSTALARKALPASVPLADAVFNLTHAIFLMRALAEGDEQGLADAMQDRLHQQFRMVLIPGAEAILNAALEAGACAAGISGSGPGMIAFTMDRGKTSGILAAMHDAALACGHSGVESFSLAIASQGAQVSFL